MVLKSKKSFLTILQQSQNHTRYHILVRVIYFLGGIMKRKLISILALLAMTATSFVGCKGNDDMIEITLNEVAHSVFYAPMYVALEEGYYEDEGLKVNLVNGLGADKTMTAVISGEADIGFMGSEASIYVYNQGAEDYVVNFAQLTQRAGNFLVSRDMNEEFTWDNVKGKTVLGGRKGD